MSNVISDTNLSALTDNEQLTKELLGIHLKNDRKVELYYSNFKKFTSGGVFKYGLCFSWYAFFGHVLYFLYRKLYLPTLMFTLLIAPGVCIITLIVAAVVVSVGELTGNSTIAALIAALLAIAAILLPFVAFATTGIYLYIKKFLRDLELSGFGELDIEKVKENLSLLGGSNDWTVTVFVITIITFIIYLTVYFLLISYYMMSYYMVPLF